MQETQERQVLSLGQDDLATEHAHTSTHTFFEFIICPPSKKEAAIYSKYNYFFYKISILFWLEFESDKYHLDSFDLENNVNYIILRILCSRILQPQDSLKGKQ